MGYGVIVGGGATPELPQFTYTGTCSMIDDGIVNSIQNYRIKFLTDGVFTPAKNYSLDVFLVGGGGGGGTTDYGGGGGGGYTTKNTFVALSGVAYTIDIGAGGAVGSNGSATTAFGLSANGGNAAAGLNGGGGGSGGGNQIGNGGSDGSNGVSNGGGGSVGTGQGSTTKEFHETTGDLYGGGGGGGGGNIGGTGGAGGGGRGAKSDAPAVASVAGTANTGGGGGGRATSSYPAAAGGSGIVVIRNKR